MRELNQQEVDESHGTEEQALDENWQPGFDDGKNSDSSLFIEHLTKVVIVGGMTDQLCHLSTVLRD